jgi:hypothetical protein
VLVRDCYLVQAIPELAVGAWLLPLRELSIRGSQEKGGALRQPLFAGLLLRFGFVLFFGLVLSAELPNSLR